MSAFIADLRISFMNLVEHGRRSMFLGAAIAMTLMALVMAFLLFTALRAARREVTP